MFLFLNRRDMRDETTLEFPLPDDPHRKNTVDPNHCSSLNVPCEDSDSSRCILGFRTSDIIEFHVKIRFRSSLSLEFK